MSKTTSIFFMTVLALVATGCDPAEVADRHTDPAPVVTAAPSDSPIQMAADVLPEAEAPADSAEPKTSPALTAFLEKFDVLSAKGFVPTLRRGSTGIGYTLETMLDIEENNSPGGDFMGMELKAFRDDDLAMNDSEKMNLFLKEPKWTCLLYTSPSPRDGLLSRMPSSA